MSDEPTTTGAGAAAAPSPESSTDAPGPEADRPADTNGSGGGAKRRRGSRGGRNRSGRPPGEGAPDATASDGDEVAAAGDRNPELPDRASENRPRDKQVLESALVRKPKIGDSRPAPQIGDSRPAPATADNGAATDAADAPAKKRRRRGGRGKGGQGGQGGGQNGQGGQRGQGGGQGGNRRPAARPVESVPYDAPIDLDDEEFERRRGRERKGRPVGRYLMCVHVQREEGIDHPVATQIAVLEGRALVEHYVSRPSDDVSQIHGNVYLGKVQNVLPGMEAAFVDIGTPKNAVLYRGDVHYDPEDVESGGGGKQGEPRIEQILRARQTILCQVTKNPIAHKGARLTQEVSLPGRFVVLIPDSSTYGISKRLPDDERKRLRAVLDKVKPAQHGVIVRTAAEGVSSEELERDVIRLVRQWEQIDALAKRSPTPALLYREPDMAVRIIREEFNNDFRGVAIDDPQLYEEVRDYVASISPALADRVELFDRDEEPLPLFERFHVHEQLHKALDRKVWLPSGGSLIIEHTEALTVIDINTGKNVGSSSLEETVFRNNLEAADEIARQLRLRDIGGIIVIDFIDMEIRKNRDEVIKRFRDALSRDKTRTQVFDISDLGLVEMTRKRIGEGLLESFASTCAVCDGRGFELDRHLLGE
jgi:ribonuclease E